MRNKPKDCVVKEVAQTIREKLGSDAKIGLILGTGWGTALKLEDEVELSFSEVSPVFSGMPILKGHSRSVVYGKLGGVPVLALRGRVHLNEAPIDPDLPDMVRLQTAMLIEAGVKDLIVTNAAGSLTPDVKVGDVMVIDGFVTLFAPPMPLYAGEFESPEDTIDLEMVEKIVVSQRDLGITIKINKGGYVMVRGPFFEGRRYDKRILANTEAKAVGMSTLPEACVAALYPGIRVIPLSFITNSAFEEHSHDSNVVQANLVAEDLGQILKSIIQMIVVK